MILFKNAQVVLESRTERLCVLTDGEKILKIDKKISESGNTEVVDCEGLFLSPGFIDLHVHGGGGVSAMCCDSEKIVKMCRAHALHGTTSILPTTLAAPTEQLLKSAKHIKKAAECCDCSNILGVHFEGPYLSPNMRGAQSIDNILSPVKNDPTYLLEFPDLKMMGVAPEIDGAFELGEKLKEKGIVASVAHTTADYDTAIAALDHGFSDVTHIYNACTSCFKRGIFREAGVVEAALTDDRYTVQVIADLRHLPLGVLKLIYKCKGADGMYLITDGLEFSASNLKEGDICVQENGVEVIYEDGVMKLADRSCLAGSAASMDILVRNMYKSVGAPLWDAVTMASSTPARTVGVADRKGYIKEGYDADILLFDGDINIKRVMVMGRFV
ncbi:MAG: N-acetylglucosamine-6-phosphate deacetylase [Oscillospiraceae bacterium]|nr:N-acetylglucosamine-6-phosphate deacetylase [Oscillospiraceae bacterium]